ncbi:hypothetical protein F2Q70_00017955 [Brassica cretica]|uniref:Uncharacterized protein n=1 Tax=Brassica cretica TaxID=69181 RepID=A0A8S9HVR1_BRACR|nr:hypothetical protein F2Q70_00017955 [Brassica cretica]
MDQTSKVQRGELQMLFAGVEDKIRSANIWIPTAEMTTSSGCVLVQMFVDKKARILRDETTYSFLGKDGNDLYCKLPQTDITSLTDVINICFVPDPQYLCADPKSSYQDDTMDDVEFVRTDGGDTAYDLGHLNDDADDAAYRRWMVYSQRKNNSLMKRILKAITGGCLGTPSTVEPRREHPTPSSHRPWKEPAGTAGAEEETPWATPRRRNRRSAG